MYDRFFFFLVVHFGGKNSVINTPSLDWGVPVCLCVFAGAISIKEKVHLHNQSIWLIIKKKIQPSQI